MLQFKKIIYATFLFLFSILFLNTDFVYANTENNSFYQITKSDIDKICESEFIKECLDVHSIASDKLQMRVENRSFDYISKEEFDLLCRCVQAEAGNQDIDVKVAIAEVILNRVECDKKTFANYNTIRDVIYAPGQFTVVTNGSINNSPTEETIMATMIAIKYRYIDSDVLYFNSIDFFSWATDYKKMGAMYLSKM